MTRDEIEQVFYDSKAILKGHFQLTSGKHASQYIQCAQVLKYPDKAALLISALKSKLTGQYDLVVGPAIGGILAAYEMARQLELPNLFTERENGKMSLRRGFQIQPGQRVLVVEDVITTGGSVQEAIECVLEAGGVVEEVAVLLDRSGGNHVLQVPVISLMEMQFTLYDPADCPLCITSNAVKPGSRKL